MLMIKFKMLQRYQINGGATMAKEKKIRVTCTLSEDEYKNLEYWAKKRDVSINIYLKDALDKAIRWENKDYDLPTLETQRLNQLIDAIAALTANQKAMEDTFMSSMSQLIGLARGDNYLLSIGAEEDE